MADITLNALFRKRAEIAGDLERHGTAARQLKIDLAHVDATILLFGPDIPKSPASTSQTSDDSVGHD